MKRSTLFSLFGVMFLAAGCPDPTTAPTADQAGDGGGAPPTAGGPAGNGAAAGGPPPDGGAAAGGDGSGPPTGGADGATGSALPSMEITGDAVKVSGTVAYSGTQAGRIQVDVVGTENDGARQRVFQATVLDSLGDFELELPAGIGDVSLVAFIDTDGNGPGPDEPGAVHEVSVQDDDVGGISLVLVDGALKPPEGKGDPSGGPPAEGASSAPPEGDAAPAAEDAAPPPAEGGE